MPRFDKWLTHVAADAPVDRVARKALATRLRAVAWFLQAAGSCDNEAEAIHQLRIWTRRTAAALRLFAPVLMDKPSSKLRKSLKKLRRTAGAVCDCDVQLEQLRAEGHEPPKRLVSELRRQRHTARRKLKALRRGLQAGRLERQSDKLLAQVAWPKRHSSREAPPFAPWCCQELAAHAAAFFESAAIEPDNDASLHELRKAGKRLRYALELAAAAIPLRLHRWLYEESSGLQDRLGAVCDRLVAVQQIHDWQVAAKKSKHRRKLAELLAGEEQRLAAARRQFLRWWTPARRQRWLLKWQTLSAV